MAQRIYITRYTVTGEIGAYLISNPLADYREDNPLEGVGEVSYYYADQNPVTRLPSIDIVVCVYRGDSPLDAALIPGVKMLPLSNREDDILSMSTARRKLLRTVLEEIDINVDLTQFVKFEDAILYIIKSVRPDFVRFGNNYDESEFN